MLLKNFYPASLKKSDAISSVRRPASLLSCSKYVAWATAATDLPDLWLINTICELRDGPLHESSFNYTLCLSLLSPLELGALACPSS